jgi:hypothetical protein
MAYTPAEMLTLSSETLDDLFRSGSAEPFPNGEADGTAILSPGSIFTHDIAQVVNIFAWKGKTFDAAHGTLTNRISVFGVNAIVAEVYKAPSLFDGNACIVLDYSKTSIVAKHVRDEIRLISPNLYLGLVYWDAKKSIHFALDFTHVS